MRNLINIAEQAVNAGSTASRFPAFKAGYTIKVYLQIQEKDKTRIQQFEGVVLQCRGTTWANKTFTVRRVSHGVAVERIFPFSLPTIEKIEIVNKGAVRRARLFYLRNKYGRMAKVKSEKLTSKKKS